MGDAIQEATEVTSARDNQGMKWDGPNFELLFIHNYEPLHILRCKEDLLDILRKMS